jgi:hypothetical protein
VLGGLEVQAGKSDQRSSTPKLQDAVVMQRLKGSAFQYLQERFCICQVLRCVAVLRQWVRGCLVRLARVKDWFYLRAGMVRWRGTLWPPGCAFQPFKRLSIVLWLPDFQKQPDRGPARIGLALLHTLSLSSSPRKNSICDCKPSNPSWPLGCI